MFDYSKVRGRIYEKYPTLKDFAIDVGMNYITLSYKINNKNYFTNEEIFRIAKKLDIDIQEIGNYFFEENVVKSKQQIEQ